MITLHVECGRTRLESMALQVRRATSLKVRIISTLMMALALVAQPFYAVMLSNVAMAATADVTRIAFTTAQRTAEKGLASPSITVAPRGINATNRTLDTDATISVSSSSTTGEFAEGTSTANPWNVSPSYTLAQGTASKSFRYKDMTVGTHTLIVTLSGGGLANDLTETQQIVIQPPLRSTNTANQAAGNPHVVQASQGPGTTTLSLVNPKPYAACFEYRTDGNTAQATSATNPYNPGVEALYPFVCTNGNTVPLTLSANEYVEVRLTFGAERNSDFDWTRFEVLPPLDTTKPTTTLISPMVNAYNPATIVVNATDNEQLSVVTANIYQGATLIKPCSQSQLTVNEYALTCEVPSTLTNGVYTVRYNARDVAGNLSTTVSTPFNIDRTKPSLNLKDTSVGSVSQRILREADFKLSDNQKVAAYRINGTRVAVSPNAFSDANDIKVGVKHGVYGMNTIQTEDSAGNLSDVFTFYLDNAPPTSTIKPESIGSGTTFSSVSYKLYDAYKIDKVTINGVEKNLTDSTYSDLNNVKPGMFGAVQGTNTLIVYDVAGNTNTYNFTLDTVKPSGMFSYSPSNDVVKTGPVTVTLTTTEAVNTPDGWTRTSDTTFTKVFSENIKGSVFVTDFAGNKSDELKYEVKRIDNTLPVIGGVQNGESRNSALTSFTVTDQNFQQAAINGTSTNCTYSGANFIWNCVGPSAEGNYALTAVDKAGNQAQAVSFTIDKQPPEPTASTSNGGQPTNQPVVVTITANEAITIADTAWNKISDTEWRRTYEQNTVEPVSVEVFDRAGNPATVSFTVSGIDQTDPSVTISQITRTSDGRYVINGTVSEANTSVRVAVGNGEAQSATMTGLTWNFTTAVLPDGTYQITVSARDAAGNTSGMQQRSFTAIAPFVGGQLVSTTPTTAPLPLTTFASSPATSQFAIGADNNGAVLGVTATPPAEDGEVLGTKDQKKSDVVAAVAPSDQGWKLWGVAWYWWLIPILIALAIWRYLVYRRRSDAPA